MPNPTLIAVTHGTPEVTSNFNPVDKSGNLTTFRGETDGPIVGAKRLFVSVKRPGAGESNFKIKIRFESPVLATDTDGVIRVARTNRWNTEVTIHKDSTSADVQDLMELALAIHGTTVIQQVVGNLEGFF